MFITPMEGIGPIAELNKADRSSAANRGAENGTAAQGFHNIFSDLIQNVRDTDKALTESQYLLSVGQVDDVHTEPIAAAKAQLSVDLLVQLRNKALDAYNEVMRMSV